MCNARRESDNASAVSAGGFVIPDERRQHSEVMMYNRQVRGQDRITVKGKSCRSEASAQAGK